MVKDSKKKKAGRPFGDPDDRRTERIAMRAHPDLVAELDVVARAEGYVRSVMIERVLIAYINHARGAVVLDAIGRYADAGGDQFPRPGGAPLRGGARTNPGGPLDHPTRRLKRP